MTGGRRCRERRHFTLPAGGCATGARSCVASNRHPLAPALGKSLGTRGRKKHLLVDWENLRCWLLACPLPPPAASASPVYGIHSPGFGDSSEGSELQTDSPRPSPEPGIPGVRGPAAGPGGAVGVGRSSRASHPPSVPEPRWARSARWDEERWAQEGSCRCLGCRRSPFVLGYLGASTPGSLFEPGVPRPLLVRRELNAPSPRGATSLEVAMGR